MKQQILKKTADGSYTIYLPEMDEQYHSMNGAVTESLHVFIERGYLFFNGMNPFVFEVGFGTGLNCLLTIAQAEKLKRPTVYYTVEKFPLKEEVTSKLDYGTLLPAKARSWFHEIHTCSWGKEVEITPHFKLCKINADFTKTPVLPGKMFNVVYFDAFGPDKQPEMWTPEIFGKIARKTQTGGVIVTYSAKGQVRRDLEATGFNMERLSGPPGKKQMLRGIKVDSNL